MVKTEWGTKRACPKCGTRFYDLQNDDPVTCIACGTAWAPEPILKSKQTTPFETAKPTVVKTEEGDEAIADDDLDIDADDEESPEDEVDIGGDDDLATVVDRDTDEEV